MFEQYAMSVAAGLVILMLIALVVLAVVLASMDCRGLVYGVVVTMGTTSVATACLVGLFVLFLFLIYGPSGRDCHRQQHDAVPALEQMSTDAEGSTGVVPSQTDPNATVAHRVGLSK